MSPDAKAAGPRPTTGSRDGKRAPVATLRLPIGRNRVGWRSIAIGVVIWCVLWQQADLLTILGGMAVTGGVALLFPMPAIRYRGTIRPLGFLRLVVVTTADLVVSSFRIAVLAADWRRPVRSAVLGVRLRTNSDLLVAMIIQLIGLVPGSVVVEHVRTSSRLYVHVLDVRDPSQLGEARERVRDVERRVLRAFGTDDELASLDRPLPDDDPDTTTAELPGAPIPRDRTVLGGVTPTPDTERKETR